MKVILLVIGVIIGTAGISSIAVFFWPEPKVHTYIADKNGLIVLSHPVEIRAHPGKIWEFLLNIEENYKAWHPSDHVVFTWTEGTPWEKGARIYSEQYMGGELVTYKGVVTESVPGRKITFTFDFPISIMNPKNEFVISGTDSVSTFCGITYLKFNKLFRLLFSPQIDEMIDSIAAHTAMENENMKRILEQ
ncbi:MAG: SRPBCC family protein [Candidatus Latescibacteria bacterium]|nr:SRPBCC family protein [Candidatus Latescibacterota bacterium]